MTVKATWNDTVIARIDDTVVVEGNHYLPSADVHSALLIASTTTSRCPRKGTAHYHTLHVDGERNPDAAWFYPDPKPDAKQVLGRIAFWKGVSVEEV